MELTNSGLGLDLGGSVADIFKTNKLLGQFLYLITLFNLKSQ